MGSKEGLLDTVTMKCLTKELGSVSGLEASRKVSVPSRGNLCKGPVAHVRNCQETDVISVGVMERIM
jgi:hypothetical protein